MSRRLSLKCTYSPGRTNLLQGHRRMSLVKFQIWCNSLLSTHLFLQQCAPLLCLTCEWPSENRWGTHTSCSQEAHGWDFSDGQVDKNPPANAGNTGLIPGPGRSYMPWAANTCPQLLGLCSAACAPQLEKPAQLERSPCSPQLKRPVRSNKDPAEPNQTSKWLGKHEAQGWVI